MVAKFRFDTAENEPRKEWKVATPSVSTGTGFYIGHKRILTNCHVVRHATSLRVFVCRW